MRRKETSPDVSAEQIFSGSSAIVFVSGGIAEIFDAVGPQPLSIDVEFAKKDKAYAFACVEAILACGLTDPKKIEAVKKFIALVEA